MKTVKEIMQRHVLAVNASASVGTAIKLMSNARVSILPVLNGSRLVGILTKKEAEAEQANARIGSLKLKLLYATEDDSIENAAKIMVSNAITRLPVVSEATTLHCVGIVSSTEIARYHKNVK
ncbi:MAG: CBS domain-containing protein [Candidatus Micrarchaeia archaeon]